MNEIWLASNTRAAVNRALAADNGNAYRRWLGRVLPHMTDAYRQNEDGVRSHLGASIVGQECDRALAYDWMWASAEPPRGRKNEPQPDAEARMLRLWNRGHLEEGRLIALLLAAGVQVYQQDSEGNQFRIAAFGGHFGGSLDGIAMGCPDLPIGVPCLLEFKTHSGKSFLDLVEQGVRLAKPQHYAQMQLYMGKRGLQYALYCASCKDDDELYFEIVMYDGVTDANYLERARSIIFNSTLPPRLRGASPSYFHCKYMCDHKLVCFHTKEPRRSCRTCQFSKPLEDGSWVCTHTGELLNKAAQLSGCELYVLADKFL